MLFLRRLCWLFCPGNRQLQVGVLINLLGQSQVDGIASLVEGPQQGNQTAGVASQSCSSGWSCFPLHPRVTRFGRQAATHASCESCCSLSSMRSSPSQCSSLASYNFASIDGYALAMSHRDEGPTTPTSRSIRPNTPARLGVPSHLLQRSKRSDARFGQRYDERSGTQLRSLLPLSAPLRT